MIQVKVPNSGWQSENLADWGTGQIQMSKILDAEVVVPVKVAGQPANAHVWLEKSPWKDGGQPFYGGYVSIREVGICLFDEDGNEQPPYPAANLSAYQLIA